jgi:hypothetical protein
MTSRTVVEGSPVLTGPWPDPVVPGISLPEVLQATAAEHAERPALIDASSGRTLYYGALAAGGVVTGINPLCTPGEVEAQLTDAGGRFVLTVPEFLPTASAAAESAAVGRASGRPRIIVLGSAPGDTVPFSALLAEPA